MAGKAKGRTTKIRSSCVCGRLSARARQGTAVVLGVARSWGVQRMAGQVFGSKFMIANVIASTPVLMVGSGTGANRGE